MVALIFLSFLVAGQLNSATATKSFHAASLLSGDWLRETEARSLAHVEQRLTHNLLTRPRDSLQALLIDPVEEKKNEKCKRIDNQEMCKNAKGCRWLPDTKQNGCRSTRRVVREGIEDDIKREIKEELREDMIRDMKKEIRRDVKERASSDVKREIQSEKQTDEMTKEVSDVVDEEVKSEEDAEDDETLTPFAEKALDVYGRSIAFFGGLLFIVIVLAAYHMYTRHQPFDEDDLDDREPGSPAYPGLQTESQTPEYEPYLRNPFNIMFLLVPLGAYAKYQSWNWWWIFWINWLALVPSMSTLSLASNAFSQHFTGQMRVWVTCVCSDIAVVIWIVLLLKEHIVIRDVRFSWHVARGILMGSTFGRQLLVAGAAFGFAAKKHDKTSFMRRYVKFDVPSVLMQAHVLLACSFGVALPSVFTSQQDVTPVHLSHMSLAMSAFILANGFVFVAWQGISQSEKQGLLTDMKEFTSGNAGVHFVAMLIACGLIILSTQMLLGTLITFAFVTGISPSCIGFMFSVLGCFAYLHIVNWSRKGEVNTAINAAFTSAIHVFLCYLPCTILIVSFVNMHKAINFSLGPDMSAGFFGTSLITLVSAIGGRADWLRGVIFACVFVAVFLSVLLQPDTYERIH